MEVVPHPAKWSRSEVLWDRGQNPDDHEGQDNCQSAPYKNAQFSAQSCRRLLCKAPGWIRSNESKWHETVYITKSNINQKQIPRKERLGF